MIDEKLKRCPFCGSDVSIFYAGTGTYQIFSHNNDCLFCGEDNKHGNDGFYINHGGIVSTDIDVIREAWNRRVI